MTCRREGRLHQTPGSAPDNVPPRKRHRLFRNHQTTHLCYGVLIAALLMLEGVELVQQLRGYSMPDSKITFINISTVNMPDTNMPDSKIIFINMSTVSTPDAKTPESKIKYIKILNVNMSDANLPATNMPDSKITFINMSIVNMPDTKTPDSKIKYIKISNVNMPAANLPDTNLPDINLPNTNFPDTNMPDSKITFINRSTVNMPDTKSPDSNIKYIKILNAVMSAVNMSATNLPDINMLDSKITHINMSTVSMSAANLPDANMTHAYMPDSKITYINISTVNMPDAKTPESKIKYIKILNVNMSNANFPEANMPDSKITFIKIVNTNISAANDPDSKVTVVHICAANKTDANMSTSNKSDASKSTSKRSDANILLATYLCMASFVPDPSIVYSLICELNRGYTNDTNTSDEVKACTDPYCAGLAYEVLSKMNTNVDPCEDFHGYACGGFIKGTEIPEGKNMVNTFSLFEHNLQRQLVSTVSERIFVNDAVPFKVAKNLYQLCMNKTRIEEQGIRPLLDNLDLLGGWPVLTGADWTKTERSWTWKKSMENLRALGYSIDYFFAVTVEENLENPSRSVIYVDQATLGITREDLVEGVYNPTVRAYFNSMMRMTVSLGAEEARARQELQDSLNFEIDLARITLPNEKRRNATAMYNPMTVEEFQSKYPNTNWLNFFNALLRDTYLDIEKNETIIVRTLSFLDQLFPLIRKTPKRTLVNYLMWRVIQFSSSFLPDQVQKHQLQSSIAKRKREYSSKECLDITTQRLPFVVETFHAKIYIDDENRRSALDVVNEVKKEFLDILKTVDWMDEITHKAALQKISSMVFRIGYNHLYEYYQDLEYKPKDSYLDAILYIDQFSTTRNLRMIREVLKKTTTHLDPAGFKFHYSAAENRVQIPAYYIQDSFFSDAWPNYMKYAVIGSFIGRAFTRGFDDHGWQFTKIGNLTDRCRTGTAFLDKASCLMKQYVTLKSKGYKSLAEKIADNGGIQLAFHAYLKWAEKNNPDELLPDLNLTYGQMFWLSATQVWCSAYRPEAVNKCATNGSTSPAPHRILEPLRNMVEFSMAFNCPSGTPMNPALKCNVW